MSYQMVVLYWKEGLASGFAPHVVGPFESYAAAKSYVEKRLEQDQYDGFRPFKLITAMEQPEL